MSYEKISAVKEWQELQQLAERAGKKCVISNTKSQVNITSTAGKAFDKPIIIYESECFSEIRSFLLGYIQSKEKQEKES